MSRFWEELVYLVLLALGFSIFIAGFNPLLKVSVSHLPDQLSGLKEAMASGQ